MIRPRDPPGHLLYALLAGGLTAVVSLAGGLAPFDLPVGDLLLPLRAGLAAGESPVAAVVLDDATLDAAGPLPWPRERLAALVDAVFETGARGLAVDLILVEAAEAGDEAVLAAAFEGRPVALAAALRKGGGWLLPPESLGGADRAAHAEAEVGPDGVVRSVLATKQRAGLALPALSLAAARLVRPSIPIAAGAELRPDFALPPDRVPRVSALELSGGGASRRRTSLLDGRLVFLGTTATAASDQFVVPVTGLSPGVLVHASAAVSILGGRLLRPLPPWAVVVGCLALAAAAQLARSRSGRVRLGHFAAAGLALLAAGAGATAMGGVRLPLVTLAVAFGASALLREAAESRRAQVETGRLLRRLVADAEDAGPAPTEAPRGAAGRLGMALELQERVIRDRDLRRTLLDSLEDGVVRSDARGRILVANTAAEELWGGAPAADPELAEAISAAAVEPGGVGPALERRGRELRLAARPLADGGFLALLRDVTAERELERRRRDMQRMVSHELKTPLASIASFGGMLERYRLSDEELARLAGLIRGESERLLDMVGTFLDLERLGGGHWESDREPVDLAALADQRAEVLSAAAEARQVTLGIAREPAAGATWSVAGDPRLLARVIDNLVGNAVKYSPAGGHIRLTVRLDGSRVELEVADEGPGIPAEALPHLFERFYRVRGAGGAGESGDRPPGASGSGLGLALVREIAEWHGGCVEVQSGPGRGSVFTVRLPALDPDRATATPTPAIPAGEGDAG